MNRSVIIGVIGALLIIGSIIGIALWQFNRTPASPTNQELLNVIIRDRAALLYKETPIIRVIGFTKPAEGWYIVTIESIHTKDTSHPAKVVILDRAGYMKVVLGPEVDFPDYITNTVTLPDSVIMGLRNHEK